MEMAGLSEILAGREYAFPSLLELAAMGLTISFKCLWSMLYINCIPSLILKLAKLIINIIMNINFFKRIISLSSFLI